MLIYFSFNFAIFLLATFFCFVLPGIWLLKSIQSETTCWEYLTLSTITGFVAFTLVGYFLLNLKLLLILLPLIFIIDLYSFKLLKNLWKKITFTSRTHFIYLLMIFIFGIGGQLLIISPSGILKNGDLVFWSSHAHDGSWHIALMEEIKKGFPLQNPVFTGEKLVNYHFFSDISSAFFNLFFKISYLDLYFRLFPFLFSLFLGCLAFYLGTILGGSFNSGLWAMIFTYFSGSFGYVATFIKNKTIGGESLFWGSQIQSSSGNPPLIESLVILLALLILLKIFYEKSKFNLIFFLILAFLLGSLIEFKSYVGVASLISIAIVGIWQIIRERKLHIFFLSLLGGIISLILYIPNSSGTVGFLIFEPWWFIRTMVVASDRLNWLDLELRRQTYLSEHNFKRVIQLEVTAFLIFLFGNLGTKFLGFWQFITLIKLSLRNYFNLNLISLCLISFILPLLFLQKGVAGNTIQFLQFFLLIFGILAGVTISNFLQFIKSNLIKVTLTIIIIILTIPTQVGLIINFYSRPPIAKIDKEELTALKFLNINTKPTSVILTPAFNKDLNLNLPTLPIWAWSDTGYVSAFSERRTYLSDTEQVDIMGYTYNARLKIQKNIFSEIKPEIFEQALKNNQINYLYYPKMLKPIVDLSKTHLKKIFSNSLVEIWQI